VAAAPRASALRAAARMSATDFLLSAILHLCAGLGLPFALASRRQKRRARMRSRPRIAAVRLANRLGDQPIAPWQSVTLQQVIGRRRRLDQGIVTFFTMSLIYGVRLLPLPVNGHCHEFRFPLAKIEQFCAVRRTT
jgi:hypothetical protein